MTGRMFVIGSFLVKINKYIIQRISVCKSKVSTPRSFSSRLALSLGCFFLKKT